MQMLCLGCGKGRPPSCLRPNDESRQYRMDLHQPLLREYHSNVFLFLFQVDFFKFFRGSMPPVTYWGSRLRRSRVCNFNQQQLNACPESILCPSLSFPNHYTSFLLPPPVPSTQLPSLVIRSGTWRAFQGGVRLPNAFLLMQSRSWKHHS